MADNQRLKDNLGATEHVRQWQRFYLNIKRLVNPGVFMGVSYLISGTIQGIHHGKEKLTMRRTKLPRLYKLRTENRIQISISCEIHTSANLRSIFDAFASRRIDMSNRERNHSLNENKNQLAIASDSSLPKIDTDLLLYAELCIVSAASGDSFSDVFQTAQTVPGLSEQPERELTNLDLAFVFDRLLRQVSGNDRHMHESIIYTLLDIIDNCG